MKHAMPGYKTHFFVGLLAGAGLATVLTVFDKMDVLTVLCGIMLSAIAALIADVDIRTSVAFKVWAASFALASIAFFVLLTVGYGFEVKYYVIAAIVSTVFLLSIFLKHRRIMHSFGAAILMSLPWLFFSPWLVAYSFIGYSSHILIDRWSPDG